MKLDDSTDKRIDPPRGEAQPLQREPPDIMRLALVFYGAMLALTVGIAWWTGASIVFASEPARERGIAAADLLVGGLAAAALVALSRGVTRTTRWGDLLGRSLAELIGRRSAADCVVLGLASGVAEEALFRGLLQPWLGYVGASLVFGLAHFVPRRELWPWTGFAVVAGLVLGALFALTGNLVAPVVAHFCINAVNLRWLSKRYG
jgi:membrane protease YdiL (CAAX protease family)